MYAHPTVKNAFRNLDACIDEVFHRCAYEYDGSDALVERKPFGILGIGKSVAFQSLEGKRVRRGKEKEEGILC